MIRVFCDVLLGVGFNLGIVLTLWPSRFHGGKVSKLWMAAPYTMQEGSAVRLSRESFQSTGFSVPSQRDLIEWWIRSDISRECYCKFGELPGLRPGLPG